MKMLIFVAIVVAYISVTDAADYPTNVTVHIQCKELSVKATWTKKEFGAGNVTKIEWRDPACQGFEESDTEFSAATNFTACQSQTSQNNDTIVHENTARVHISYKIDIIQRDIIYNFILRCTIQRSIYTPLGASYNVTEKRFFGSINKTASADFSVLMDIYKDNTFSEILDNPTATSFDPIYIGIREAKNNPMLKFVVQQCFATPSRSRRDVSYIFFYNKCPVDESFRRVDSTSEHRYNFVVDAFKFIRLSKSVFVHCRLLVCKTNATSEACKQEKSCEKRRRRAVTLGDDGSGDDKPLEEITVMTQKLTFVERSCKETICPAYSSCLDLNPPVCRCGYGYVFKPNTNSCNRERTFTIYGLHFDMPFDKSYRDPYSKSFVALAIRIEKQLNEYVRRLGDDSIVGMKVIRAREGSVVVDVKVMYRESSSESKAYATFLKSISKSHTDTVDYADALPIKPITPIIEKKEDTAVSLTLILSVVIPLVAAVMVVAYVIKEREKLCCRSKVKVIKLES